MKKIVVLMTSILFCNISMVFAQMYDEEKILLDLLQSKIKYEEALKDQENAKKNANFMNKFKRKYPDGVDEIIKAYSKNIAYIKTNKKQFEDFFERKEWKDGQKAMPYNYIDPLLSTTYMYQTKKSEYYRIVDVFLLKENKEYLPKFLKDIEFSDKSKPKIKAISTQ
ncbi:hypothetical protein [Sphingobacterium kyonggiense]